MSFKTCDVCEEQFTNPDSSVSNEKDIPKEELVCGSCWAHINFSNLSTEECVNKIRSEKK